ncbi:hypothetical protein VaNZ11_010944, partial [Volvox africanus]
IVFVPTTVSASAVSTPQTRRSGTSAQSLRSIANQLHARTSKFLKFIEGIQALVSNHLTPGAVDIPGMAPAAAATTCAAVAGTSARPPGPPHTGHEDEVIKIAIAVPKLNIPMDVKLSDLGRVAAPLTRAFVRNVRNYFATARG